MSSPYTLPVGPTRFADRNTSMPPPDPRSRTVSPSPRSINAVGLPQPSETFSASAGTAAPSASLYRFAVIGSPQLPPQHSASGFPVATLPYLSRIASFKPWESTWTSSSTRAIFVKAYMDRGLAQVDRLLKALADPTRLRIVGLLQGGELFVCNIHDSLT